MLLPTTLRDLAQRSAAPAAVLPWLDQVLESGSPHDGATLAGRLAADDGYAGLVVTVVAASRSLARLVANDAEAADVLARLDEAVATPDATTAGELARWKRHELLRTAARDLSGRDCLAGTGERLATMGDLLLQAACRIAGAGQLAVIGMGKLGAQELNYSSDVDILFVGTGQASDEVAARRVLEIARHAVRVDAALRPEGRDGPLVRSLGSYLAYWDRWARPWERQALIKARHVGGDGELGARFEAAAAERVWRGLDADAIVELRAMKARAEHEVERKGLGEREIKLGPGGIRDVEFAVQLLQLVHGPHDPALRLRATVPALGELAGAGYIGSEDASALTLAYTFLRTVEHRLQLLEEAQVHTVPTSSAARDHLARVLGLEGAGLAPADRLAEVLTHHQATVRSIHERLYFRPLLESFTTAGGRLDPAAAEQRLAAFGFREADRTRQALRELTSGLTRSSRLMQQMMPLILDWCSASPDPDLALLGLRSLAASPQSRDVLVAACRESPEAARRLCLLAGTSRELVELLRHEPAVLATIGDDRSLAPRSSAEYDELVGLRTGRKRDDPSRALRRLVSAELARLAARDVLVDGDVSAVGAALSDLGRAVLAGALAAVAPEVPLAIVAMGRLGGREQA